ERDVLRGDEGGLVHEVLDLATHDAVERLAEEAGRAAEDVDQPVVQLGDDLRGTRRARMKDRGARDVEREKARHRLVREGPVVPEARRVVPGDEAPDPNAVPTVLHAARRKVIVEPELDPAERPLDETVLDIGRDEPRDEALRVVLWRRVGARERGRDLA